MPQHTLSQYKTQTDRRGYVKLNVGKHHPMAPANGMVGRHRLVLWQHHGEPDPFTTGLPCHLCSYVLPWRHPFGIKHCVNVDHLNEQPGDDRVENLAASCYWCNSNRSWVPWINGEPTWREIIAMYSAQHPAERPDLRPVVAAMFNLEADELQKVIARIPSVRQAFAL